MWETTLFVTTSFMGGWLVRYMTEHKVDIPRSTGKPEMMWFDEQSSRWERVTEMYLKVADRVVVSVPVKLISERDDAEC